MSLKNKVALITGGSSGIGAATAILFAKEGAYVAVVARNEEKLKNVKSEIDKVGAKPLIIIADLSVDIETKAVVSKTIDTFGKLDILVNNAGVIRYASVLNENLLQVYDEVISINLRAVVLLTNLAVPYLIKTRGNIVNISSAAGTIVLADKHLKGFASYCTSKAGMDHFSRYAAIELAEKGVRVNIISPGPVETDILKNAGGSSEWDLMAEKTALKILTKPEEVADLVLYLASDKGRSVTGSNYTIDAGLRMYP